VTARVFATALALSVAFACACGAGAPASGTDAATEVPACVRTDPSCPEASAPPSYATTVHSIFVTACVNCHYPGSTLAYSSLATYEDVHLVYGSALGQVSSCLMPPAGQPPLTEADRTALLTWLVCGAPEN